MPKVPPNPELRFAKENSIYKLITQYREEHEGTLTFLNLGSGKTKNPEVSKGYEVTRTDLYYRNENTVKLDACEPFPFEDDAFDIVFTRNVLEHLYAPWKTARECVRVCKPGGLNIHAAPFAWRYHGVPNDYFRFTHQGMEILFGEETEILFSGYDVS